MNYYLQLQEMYIDTVTDYLDILPGTLYSVDPRTRDPGTQGPGTQGPKLACTVCVCTVALSLGKYPGPRGPGSLIARLEYRLAQPVEWAIEFSRKNV